MRENVRDNWICSHYLISPGMPFIATDRGTPSLQCYTVLTDFREEFAPSAPPRCWAKQMLCITWEAKAEKFALLQILTLGSTGSRVTHQRLQEGQQVSGNHLPSRLRRYAPCYPPILYTIAFEIRPHNFFFFKGWKSINKLVVTNLHAYKNKQIN